MIIAKILDYLLLALFLLLIFRVIMEYVFMLARSYRPSGVVAALLELTYTVTDPPLNALRRIVPPLRIGSVSLDLGFLLLIILIQVVRTQVLQPLF